MQQTGLVISPSVDIFCRILDNFGDLGVTWRLARQLAGEKNCKVRLIADDFSPLRAIAPGVPEPAATQTLDGVTLLRWEEAVLVQHYGAPAEVVIEAFACALSDFVVAAMAHDKKSAWKKSIWLDLEYMSAEDWVSTCHAVPSIHPGTGLCKTLFIPGMGAGSGGLTREENLLHLRDEFQASPAAQNNWRAARGLPETDEKTLDISLFCYPQAPVPALFSALEGRDVRVFVPEKIAAQMLQHYTGPVPVYTFPYLPQDEYDRLLWTMDLNFVRGEDSFVRAFWAGRPFIWNIYPQELDAHFPKLDAFLEKYSQKQDPESAQALAEFSRMWNLRGRAGPASVSDMTGSAARFLADLPALARFARHRADEQAGQADLATQLLRFIASQSEQEDNKD